MRKLKNSVAVIGEGITEQYYVQSLKDVLNITPAPFLPKKSTSLQDLEDLIDKCLSDGYSSIYCLIDMDNKQSGHSKTEYLNLKGKYKKKYKNVYGELSEILFIENNPCTEIWFYYYL